MGGIDSNKISPLRRYYAMVFAFAEVGVVERKKRFNIHFALYPDKYGLLAVIFRFVVCLIV